MREASAERATGTGATGCGRVRDSDRWQNKGENGGRNEVGQGLKGHEAGYDRQQLFSSEIGRVSTGSKQ